MEDTNIEIVLAYLMVLGSPAAVWGTFITVIEGISGDLSSDEAKEAKKKRDKWQEEKKRHKEEEKRRREEIAANKEKAKNEVKDDIPDGEDNVDVIPQAKELVDNAKEIVDNFPKINLEDAGDIDSYTSFVTF